ncbi:S4 domain protein YaaA [Bacillus mesophilus]|uniref:S4 domain-containing protein YaaA n=1 Tax=Bacillus mesophilus TaxID=1808955 RepID=A0A6M0Q9Y4_9BACI|nr:S4 domain-containing protein YaaA [Bacillus mesophilus]MBM7662208.1 S4 domain protein YaaA [Bacillus mesophilus]NEY73152.1 S4 domain-containing protein YaaA [Bacillus mesophilus]
MTKEVTIHSEYITLGQFLKLADIIDSGGMAKWFLQEHHITVNGEEDNRRGRKLRDGDSIVIKDVGRFTVSTKE